MTAPTSTSRPSAAGAIRWSTSSHAMAPRIACRRAWDTPRCWKTRKMTGKLPLDFAAAARAPANRPPSRSPFSA
jgi:hypothetical protein